MPTEEHFHLGIAHKLCGTSSAFHSTLSIKMSIPHITSLLFFKSTLTTQKHINICPHTHSSSKYNVFTHTQTHASRPLTCSHTQVQLQRHYYWHAYRTKPSCGSLNISAVTHWLRTLNKLHLHKNNTDLNIIYHCARGQTICRPVVTGFNIVIQLSIFKEVLIHPTLVHQCSKNMFQKVKIE